MIILLFATALVLAFAIGSHVGARELERRERRQIEAVVERLAAIHATGGAAALEAELAARAAAGWPGGDLLLWSHDGDTVGNMTLARPVLGWTLVDEHDLRPGDGVRDTDFYYALGIDLGEGVLVAARSGEVVDELNEVLAGALGYGFALSAALSTLGAAGMAWRSERRIAALGAALDAVARGDLARRAPLTAADDDIDRVSGAVNAMLDRLSATVAGLKQVSADIAHDLRTPIQQLRGTLEALSRAHGVDAATSARIDEAQAKADAIVRLFEVMLRIAEIEAGGVRARFRIIDLTELARAVADAFAPVAEEAGHRFEAILPDGPALVRGDRDLLAQMLINLIENAIRHCPAPAAIALTLEAGPRDWTLGVRDDGPGVPAEERANVLRRFYRLERSRTTDGSGLGLSLAAAVAGLHDGELTLDDALPGLRVRVRLAKAPAPSDREA